MLFPRVKHQTKYATEFALSAPLTLKTEGFADKAKTALSIFLPYAKVELCDDAVIIAKNTLQEKERYTLLAKNGRIEIAYGDYTGLRNALATLSQLVVKRDGALYIKETEIDDCPEASHRGIMLDPARKPMDFERLKYDLIVAAKCKMNVFHFHFAEAEGIAVRMDCLPNSAFHEDAYTKEQIKELNELCDVLALEIIPEFDMPGHSFKLTSAFPNLCCKGNIEKRSDWVICAGNEDTYALYEKIIAETFELFPSGRYFHMGGDELEMLDEGAEYLNYRCHWDDCDTCRALMQKEGIDRRGLYYYFVNRINAIVKKHGRRMIMWNDQVDCTRPRGIDADVIMDYWRVAGRGRGPVEGCSMQKLLDYGYDVINCNYPDTYVDFESYMTTDKLAGWHWHERPECKPENKAQILGSEVNAWEYGNEKEYSHYAHSLPSAIALMADKLWMGDKHNYTVADRIALTRTLLGACVPEGFNVFDAIGSIFPPRDTKTNMLSYRGKVVLSESEIKDVISVLESTEFEGGDKFRAKTFTACVNYTYEKLKKYF